MSKSRGECIKLFSGHRSIERQWGPSPPTFTVLTTLLTTVLWMLNHTFIITAKDYLRQNCQNISLLLCPLFIGELYHLS